VCSKKVCVAGRWCVEGRWCVAVRWCVAALYIYIVAALLMPVTAVRFQKVKYITVNHPENILIE
jgi:hypothetical protein